MGMIPDRQYPPTNTWVIEPEYGPWLEPHYEALSKPRKRVRFRPFHDPELAAELRALRDDARRHTDTPAY